MVVRGFFVRMDCHVRMRSSAMMVGRALWAEVTIDGAPIRDGNTGSLS